jgi:hypothetical protein
MEVELFLAGVTLILGLVMGRRALIGAVDLGLHDICLVVTSVFFGAGVFLAWLNSEGEIPKLPGDIAVATYLTIWTFQIGLAFVGAATRGADRRRPVRPMTMVRIARIACLSRSMRGLTVLLVLWISILAFRVWCGVKYGFWASGSATQEVIFGLGYRIFIGVTLADFFDRALIFWAAVRLWSGASLRERLLSIAIIGTGLFYHFSKGRRELLGMLVVMALGYIVAFRKVTLKAAIAVAIIAPVLYYVIFPIFCFARFQTAHRPKYEQTENALQSWVEAVGESLGEERSFRNEIYKDNLSVRPLIHRFIGEIIANERDVPLLYGSATKNAILMNVPSVLWRGKRAMPGTEALVMTYYGMGEVDGSITPVALGVADFGLMGGLFAGLALGGFFSLIQLIASKHAWKYPLLSLGVMGMVLSIVLRFEEEPSGYIGILRQYVIILVPIWLWSHLRPFRLRMVQMPPPPEPESEPEPEPLPCPPAS